MFIRQIIFFLSHEQTGVLPEFVKFSRSGLTGHPSNLFLALVSCALFTFSLACDYKIMAVWSGLGKWILLNLSTRKQLFSLIQKQRRQILGSTMGTSLVMLGQWFMAYSEGNLMWLFTSWCCFQRLYLFRSFATGNDFRAKPTRDIWASTSTYTSFPTFTQANFTN